MKKHRSVNIEGPSILLSLEKLKVIITLIILGAVCFGFFNWWLKIIDAPLSPSYRFYPLPYLILIILSALLIIPEKTTHSLRYTNIARLTSLTIIFIALISILLHFNRGMAIENSALIIPENSAFLFLLTGISLLFLNSGKPSFAHSVALLIISIAVLLLIGYAYQMPEFFIPFQIRYISVPETILLLLLAVSILLAGKNKGYMAEIISPYSGGHIARKLLPMLFLTPLFFGIIRLYSEKSGLYTAAQGTVLFFGAVLIIFLFTILNSVKEANKLGLSLEAEIDEREKAETEIKNSNRFLETILENIPNMIFVKKGRELRFAALNKAGEQLLGISRQEYIGKTDDDVFPKEQAEFFKKKDWEVFENETVVVIEEEPVYTKDGERWLRTKKIPVKDENGLPLYIVGISEDITEKREQDEKLKQFYTELEHKVKERTRELSNSEKRFRALIENSTDGITITNSSSEIIYESPAVERMTGYPLKERTGTSLFDHIYPDDLEKCHKLYQDLSANPGKPIFGQFRIIHKNEDYIWIEGTATNLERDESVKATIFNYRDITERKKHEHEREVLIQQLTRHNKDLRQFSYITSHNLRAPVSNLLGLLGLLNFTHVEDQSLKEIINGFKISTNSLNDTINDLLSILYIKENSTMELEDIHVPGLIEKIFGQVSNLIEKIDPEIEADLKPGSIIHFNKAYLESIFLNLLTNALKYRSAERRLKLTLKLEEFEDKTVVCFQDNGIGLDLESCKTKIFGLYQKFHNHPDSKGLGLYLVKTHMEALGGSIEIESALNIGTKFILTFNKIYAEQSSVH